MSTTYHLIKDRILSKGTLFHHVFTLLRGKFEYELTKKKKAMDLFPHEPPAANQENKHIIVQKIMICFSSRMK